MNEYEPESPVYERDRNILVDFRCIKTYQTKEHQLYYTWHVLSTRKALTYTRICECFQYTLNYIHTTMWVLSYIHQTSTQCFMETVLCFMETVLNQTPTDTNTVFCGNSSVLNAWCLRILEIKFRGVCRIICHDNKKKIYIYINLNKQKLGEPQVYLKPVEQTLYSATVPIKRNVCRISHLSRYKNPVVMWHHVKDVYYRVAKTHRIPYLYRSFFAKVTSI